MESSHQATPDSDTESLPILFRGDTGIVTACPNTLQVQAFHEELPGFNPTPLHPLDGLADQMGVKAVYLKDESNRMGLPAFKILGASWGCVQAIVQRLRLPISIGFIEIARAAREGGIELYTASAGNHGRALAAMARIIGLPAHIYVPKSTSVGAVQNISSEGANVVRSQLDYDGAVVEAWTASKKVEYGLFVQDASFQGYHDVPEWIVQGYSTMLIEIERQLAERALQADAIVTPVGVGSLAHAVVRHCKSGTRNCAVMTVEPNAAACVYKSLELEKLTSVTTRPSIMEGLNCGTVSTDVFQDLLTGVDACVTVSDMEAHEGVQYLANVGIRSGPCGGATVTAIKRVAMLAERPTWLSNNAVVVLLCTEGPREYRV